LIVRIGVLVAVVFLSAACSSSAEPDVRAAADRFNQEHPELAGTVSSVELWGDEAMAHVGDTRMYLHRFDDGWRVTGAGCRGEPGGCEVGGP
jgi:hypothetical protein